MALVSIIMGVYNSNNVEMLNQSINSILHQTFQDFEFIICDDGSDDGTYEALKEIVKKDARIILLRNENNSRIASTLNRCIDMSTGKYIARQDADDISRVDRIEKQVLFLNKNKEYSFVSSNVALFNERNTWGEYILKERPEKKDFLFRLPFVHAAVMVRREALASAGNFEVSRWTRRNEDYALCMKMYSMGLRGYNIQEKLLSVRENNEAYKRRKYRYRIDEAWIRYHGFKELGLMPMGIIYVVKPLLLGLIPWRFLITIKDRMMGRRTFDIK